jgi:hypothetical protein
MIMENRSRRLSEPLRWRRREKTVVAVLVSCLALALIGLGAYALTSGSREPKDCVDATVASSLGAAYLHACGARARAMCASSEAARQVGQPLREACRRAGFPFG